MKKLLLLTALLSFNSLAVDLTLNINKDIAFNTISMCNQFAKLASVTSLAKSQGMTLEDIKSKTSLRPVDEEIVRLTYAINIEDYRDIRISVLENCTNEIYKHYIYLFTGDANELQKRIAGIAHKFVK